MEQRKQPAAAMRGQGLAVSARDDAESDAAGEEGCPRNGHQEGEEEESTSLREPRPSEWHHTQQLQRQEAAESTAAHRYPKAPAREKEQERKDGAALAVEVAPDD